MYRLRHALMGVGAFLALASAGSSSALAGWNTIEGFESGNLSGYTTVAGFVDATVSSAHAHDGNFGLGIGANTIGWIYRDDAAVQLAQGDTFSVWVRFNNTADSRAYFGFGSSAAGTLSFVLAPNTGDIRFQENPGYGFTELNTSAQSFVADKWYRAEVEWQVGGNMTGRLYDSDGTTLLNSVSASSNLTTSGGIAFRGFGGIKSFDTVERLEDTQAVPLPGGVVLFGLGVVTLGAGRFVRRKLMSA